VAPETHLLISWLIAAKTTDHPRDCRLVTLAGLAPDADGLGLILDLANNALGRHPTQFYAQYHHYYLHGLFGAALIAGVSAAMARRRVRVALLALVVVHLHLLCDLLGSRGPSSVDLWPIFYYGPFARDPMWLWKGQWRLDGWQNRLISVTLFGCALWLPLQLGHSIVGVFSQRADRAVVGVLRKWHDAFIARVWPQR